MAEAALTGPRLPLYSKFSTKALPMPASTQAWQGGAACLDSAAGVVRPGVSGNANLTRVGLFGESVLSPASGTYYVLVVMDKEITAQWFDNYIGDNVVALYSTCYIGDDHSVRLTSTGNSVSGRVWEIDAVKGVLVETAGVSNI